MTRTKTISAVFAAVLVVLAGGAAVTLAATDMGGTGANAAIQDDETTTVAVNETTTEIEETPTEAGETPTEVGETPTDGLAQESFNVSNLTAPATANVSETVTVAAQVSNPSDQEATQNVEFRLDGNVVERQEVTLGAGESQNVSFEVDTTDVEAGLHVHSVQTRNFGEVGQITLLSQPETPDEETPTEVDETPTETDETPTEIEDTPTEVDETPTEIEDTPTEVDETPTEVEETPTEIEEVPEVPDQLVFQVEQVEIDEWSFVVGDELEPDRTETIEGIEIRDRTQRINLTELMQEDGTVEDAMGEQVETPSDLEGTEDLETVRVVVRDVTIENVTFIVELPEEGELPEMPEMPETPDVETPTEIEETPTEVEDTPTEVEETPTEVEETPTEVEETPTEVEDTPTAVQGSPTEAPDTPEDVVGPGAQSFDVASLNAPETAEIGETITVGAEISNPNEEQARQEVELRLDGDLVERENVTLDADESQEVSFEVDTTGLEAGTAISGVLTDEFGELAQVTLEEPTEEETPTEVDETPTEVDETPTEVDDEGTPTEVDETPTEIDGDETPTEVDDEGTPTEVEDDGTPTEIDDDGTPTEEE